ncbi:FCD domain-containing protein [Acidiferrimicrobium sp. IK]|uniref:FadR/GntR family transcriptional regulator n=1 Tax=Acidiferrimicrobium sp. IK TaxID=2871700 RepID=UPI0021CB3EB8|nr:FCD domain-containing protein [Acidiferrimicrobium sp. IK]MCU4182773.1 FCD domain-containing protein [Acidiferrimicrobium sp. IK]
MTTPTPTLTLTPTRTLPAELALAGELDAARQRDDGRLPPERELAARHGLSRTAVRAWLDRLEHSGAVVRHVGRGTFVAPAVTQDLSPAQIMAVRLLLEPQMLGLAVAHATASDIAEMRRCLAEGRAAPGFDEFEVWDARLHAAIAASTANPLLVQLFEVSNAARDSPVWGNAKRRAFTAARRDDYQRDHEALVEAIADRDAPQAAEVMRQHLLRIRTSLLGDPG